MTAPVPLWVRNKYKAIRTKVDGRSFASKLEARLYAHLDYLRKMGDVQWFIRQPSFDVAEGVKYRADFLVVNRDGSVEVMDAKGMDTPNSKTKRAVVEEKYGIKIKVITKAELR